MIDPFVCCFARHVAQACALLVSRAHFMHAHGYHARRAPSLVAQNSAAYLIARSQCLPLGPGSAKHGALVVRAPSPPIIYISPADPGPVPDTTIRAALLNFALTAGPL